MQRRPGDPRHVPCNAQYVVDGVEHGFRVVRARCPQRIQLALREGKVLDRLARPRRAGVVDQDIKPAMAGQQLLDRRPHLRRVASVHHHCRGPVFRSPGFGQRQFPRHVHPCSVAPGEHDGCALNQITAHDRAAEVAGGPSDKGHLSREPAWLAHRGRADAIGSRGLIDNQVHGTFPSIACQVSSSASLPRSPAAGRA